MKNKKNKIVTSLTFLSRLVKRSIWERRFRFAIALLSTIMAVSLTSSFLNLSLDIEHKMHRDLRSYGPNLILAPSNDLFKGGNENLTIPVSILETLRDMRNKGEISGFVPFQYRKAKINRTHEVILAVTDLKGARSIYSYWDLEGQLMNSSSLYGSGRGFIILGSTLAKKLEGKSGDEIELEPMEDQERSDPFYLQVGGILETGGVEDNIALIDFREGKNLFGGDRDPNLVAIRAVGTIKEVEHLSKSIEISYPSVKASLLRKITESEGRFLGKLRWLMGSMTLIILVISSLCTMTTLTYMVIERRKEIGLQKAIGADNRRIIFQFLTESITIGIAGGIGGMILGILLGKVMSQTIFATDLSFRSVVIPIDIGLALAISIISSLLPIRQITETEAAVVLKEE